MIKIVAFEKSVNKELNNIRVTFYLKKTPNIWLSDNKLILEYPYDFINLTNLGLAAVFSILPIAYHENSDIELCPELSIDNDTQDRINNICNIWNNWFCCNRKIKILAIKKTPSIQNTHKRFTGQLFSAGVDSLATFKRHESEINCLFLFKGIDISVNELSFFNEIYLFLKTFAEKRCKKIYVFSTNAQFLSNASWVNLAYACCMVGPLLATAEYVKKSYIAGAYYKNYTDNIPSGSHYLTDKFISNKYFTNVHDGEDLKRTDKILSISTQKELLSLLRVCLKHNNKLYNCGTCEKCARTITALLAEGIEYSNTNFPKETFTFEAINKFLDTNELNKSQMIYWSENLELLEKNFHLIPKAKNLIDSLHSKLNSFYDNYKDNFSHDCPIQEVSDWRKFEKKLGLNYDSLDWIRKLKHAIDIQGRKKFTQKMKLLS